MAETVNLEAASLLAMSVSLRVVETLAQKGILSEQEGLQLYQNALSTIGEGPIRDEAKRILKLLLTDPKI